MKHSSIALLCILLIVSCSSGPRGPEPAPLQELPLDREYVLAAQQVDDARLPRLSAAEFADVLGRVSAYVREYLGYHITFTAKRERDLLSFKKDLAYIDSLPAMKEAKSYLLDPSSQTDRERLRSDIAKTVQAVPERVLRMHMKNFGAFPNRAAAAERVYLNYVDVLQKIYQLPTQDVTLLASPGYVDTLTYPFWDVAIREYADAQFIVSNTVMADMETDLPIYVILRGGVTTGMTEKNPSGPAGGSVVLFTLPFISKDNFFEAAREEKIPAAEKTDVIALYAVHEFGHLLNHFKDYSDHEHCIMVPAHGLNYYKWYRENKANKCALPHEKLKSF
jgi:hypothetical protein